MHEHPMSCVSSKRITVEFFPGYCFVENLAKALHLKLQSLLSIQVISQGKEDGTMFVNCYNGYGLCLFSVTVKEGVRAEKLGNHIYDGHWLVDHWSVSDAPEGAVVRY